MALLTGKELFDDYIEGTPTSDTITFGEIFPNHDTFYDIAFGFGGDDTILILGTGEILPGSGADYATNQSTEEDGGIITL